MISQSIIESLQEAFEQQAKVTLLVKGFFPINNGLITKITEETITVVTPLYNEYQEKSQLHRYTFCKEEVKGVGIILSSIDDYEDDIDFLNYNDGDSIL